MKDLKEVVLGAAGIAFMRNALLAGESPILGRCVLEGVDLARGVVTSVSPALKELEMDSSAGEESFLDWLEAAGEGEEARNSLSMIQAAAARIQEWLKESTDTACIVEEMEFAPGDRAFMVGAAEPPTDYTYHVLPPGEHSLDTISAFLAMQGETGSFFGVVTEWPGIGAMVGSERDVEMEDLETIASSARLIFVRPAGQNRWVFWEKVS